MAITHPTHPAVITEGRCNALMWNCKGKDDEGNECDYHYTDEHAAECPHCGTPRRRCLNFPEKGREACRFHGGRALRGHQSPLYKGKGFSKFLPTRLMEHLRLSLGNPDILNLTTDIALLEARQTELAARLEEKDWGPGVWVDLVKTFEKFDRERRRAANPNLTSNQRKTATQKMSEYLKEVEDLILRGYFYDEKVWDEIREIQKSKVQLTKVEMQRRKQAEEIVTVDEFKNLLGYIINSVKTRVSNPDEVMKVLSDIQNLSY